MTVEGQDQSENAKNDDPGDTLCWGPEHQLNVGVAIGNCPYYDGGACLASDLIMLPPCPHQDLVED